MTSWRTSGRAHGGQRQRHVVEGDGERHPRAKQRRQRLGVAQGVLQGVADGAHGVGQGVDGLGRVQDPAADGQLLEPVALAVPEQGGWRRAVDLEDESGPGAHGTGPFVWRCPGGGPGREVEDDLHRAPASGRAGVGQRLLEAVDGVAGRHQPPEARGRHHLHGDVEGAPRASRRAPRSRTRRRR